MSLTKVKAGNILLTTPGASSNDVTPATTQYVTTAISNLVDTAPSTLNTLNELAAALGDDVNFSTTVTNSIATKLPLAGGTMTGTLTVPTLITGAYGGSGSAGDGFRLNSTDLYGQIDASDKIRLNVNGDSFLNGGNVGIGTTSPANKLHVKAGASGATTFDSRYNLTVEDDGENYLGIYAPNNSFSGVRFVNANNSIRGHIDYYLGTQGDKFVMYSQNGWDFQYPSVGLQQQFKPNGNLNLGATHSGFSGWRVLNIRQSSTGGMVNFDEDDGTRAFTFANEGVGMRYQAHITGGYHRFETHALGGGTAMMILDNGNVGIGTTGPYSKLQVSGTVSSGTNTKPTHAVYDSSGNMKSFEHVFSATKGTTSGAINKTLVDVSGLSNFHQAIFIVEYGTRLQGISDSNTGFVHRVYALNRFNGGNLNVTETTAIAGSSNSLAHALIDVEIVSNTQYRIRVEFSSSVTSSSFASGTIRAYGLSDYFPTISFAEGMGG